MIYNTMPKKGSGVKCLYSLGQGVLLKRKERKGHQVILLKETYVSIQKELLDIPNSEYCRI
jgi:hypothetical protein